MRDQNSPRFGSAAKLLASVSSTASQSAEQSEGLVKLNFQLQLACTYDS